MQIKKELEDLKEKHKVSIWVALISAFATLVGGFFGGQAVTTNNFMQIIQNSTNITINEGESTGEALNRLIDISDGLRTASDKQQNEISDLKMQIEAKEKEISDLNSQISILTANSENSANEYGSLENSYNSVLKERDELKKRLNDTLGFTAPSTGTALASMEVFNNNCSRWYVNEKGKEDTLGVDYSDSKDYIVVGYREWSTAECGHAEYYIDGRYKRLQGRIAAHSSSLGESTSTIQIYGDDKLLFESKAIGIRTDVSSFVLDADKMEGVRFLKIVQCGDPNIKLLLTDWTLS